MPHRCHKPTLQRKVLHFPRWVESWSIDQHANGQWVVTGFSSGSRPKQKSLQFGASVQSWKFIRKSDGRWKVVGETEVDNCPPITHNPDR